MTIKLPGLDLFCLIVGFFYSISVFWEVHIVGIADFSNIFINIFLVLDCSAYTHFVLEPVCLALNLRSSANRNSEKENLSADLT